jgi:hypothetical protein
MSATSAAGLVSHQPLPQYALLESQDISVFSSITLNLCYEEQKKLAFSSKRLFSLMTATHVLFFNKCFKICDAQERFGLQKCLSKYFSGKDCLEISGRIEELMLGVKIYGKKYIDQIASVKTKEEFEQFTHFIHSKALVKIFCCSDLTKNALYLRHDVPGSTWSQMRCEYARFKETVDKNLVILPEEKKSALLRLAEKARAWLKIEENCDSIVRLDAGGIVPIEFKNCRCITHLLLLAKSGHLPFSFGKYVRSLPKVTTLHLAGGTDFKTVPAEIGKVPSAELMLAGPVDRLSAGLKRYKNLQVSIGHLYFERSLLFERLMETVHTNTIEMGKIPEDCFEKEEKEKSAASGSTDNTFSETTQLDVISKQSLSIG